MSKKSMFMCYVSCLTHCDNVVKSEETLYTFRDVPKTTENMHHECTIHFFEVWSVLSYYIWTLMLLLTSNLNIERIVMKLLCVISQFRDGLLRPLACGCKMGWTSSLEVSELKFHTSLNFMDVFCLVLI